MKFFESEQIIRLTPISSESVEIAENILSGDIRVFPKLPNILIDEVSYLWEMNFSSAPSTYALYVYALYPVSYLLNAFEVTGSYKFLEHALSSTIDFLTWELKDNKKIGNKRKNILFGDHAVSNRTQTLCYLTCCLKHANKNIPEAIKSALLRNGQYLSDKNNYSHYNHGLMMDLALLGLLNTFQGLSINYPNYFKENLISRLRHSITRDLTRDGVHVENSPGYHFWMLRFLKKITSSLKSLDQTTYSRARKLLDSVSDYACYITRPDGSVPTVGDTHSGLKSTPSKGLNSKFFKDADQVIFRDKSNEVWAHFASGYKTHVHKHCDNGAFNLYYKGQDLFVDPGFLNYERSAQSKNIKSTAFHSTAIPKGKEQLIVQKDLSEDAQSYEQNLSNSKVVGFQRDNEIEYSLAVIADYEDCEIERLIVWLKPNVFLIFDSVYGHDDGLEQVFHISPSLDIQLSSSSAKLISSSNQIVATVSRQSLSMDNNFNSELSVKSAFCATNFSVSQNSQRLVFETNESNILTVVELISKQESMIEIDGFNGVELKYILEGKLRVLDLIALKSSLS